MSFWLAYFWPDKYIILLSKGEREAISLLQKAKYGFKYLPEWMLDRGPSETTRHGQKMGFDNDSSVESYPSRDDPARGESVYLIVVDEWAMLLNPEEAWAAIEPTADVGGRVVGLSTAKGYGDFFHQMWQRAVGGRSKFKPIFHPWSANTDRSIDWYDDKVEELPEWQLHREYPRDADEAFIKAGNPLFDPAFIDGLGRKTPLRGYLHPLSDTYLRNFEWRNQLDGPFKIWEQPDRMDAYVIGVDVAYGLEWGDYSSAHVINVRTGLVAAQYHAHIGASELAAEVARLGWYYNKALLGIENNNHGHATCEAAMRLGYPNLYFSVAYATANAGATRKIGWSTTVSTKALLVDEFSMALKSGELICWDEETLHECKTFVRDPDGKMHGSPFDDRVISLGIAHQMRKWATAPEYHQKQNDYWTLDWWDREMKDANNDSNLLVIGKHNTY